ncbi:unnamed protein product [Allacma fusca]|uniref:Secreted protein n=1 Tax=Allacma fusca TaxID=39272 RepID=A0A8J2LPM0_9HEXA|nr:unnamed protein product [Allacma fusca]
MSTGSVILVLTWLAIHSVESQFGQEYRSWLGLALRSNPFIPTCQPDGEPCERVTSSLLQWVLLHGVLSKIVPLPSM